MRMTTGEQLRETQKAFAEPLMKRIRELEDELATLKAKAAVPFAYHKKYMGGSDRRHCQFIRQTG